MSAFDETWKFDGVEIVTDAVDEAIECKETTGAWVSFEETGLGLRSTHNQANTARNRLASAAPDLYRALEVMIAAEGWVAPPYALSQALAALKKARGET